MMFMPIDLISKDYYQFEAIITSIQLCQQQMHNFNNKTEGLIEFTHCKTEIGCDLSHLQSYLHDQQENATECLLQMSQYENQKHDHTEQEDKYEGIKVTPWTRVQFRLRDSKSYGRSKTSMLLPPCRKINHKSTSQKQQMKIKHKNKENKQDKQNIEIYHSKEKLEKQKRLPLTQKNMNEIKNSYSTFTRYAETQKSKNITSKEISEFNKSENRPSAVYVHCESQREKVVSMCIQKPKRSYKRFNENDTKPKYEIGIPKITISRDYTKGNTKNDQILCVYLKQDTRNVRMEIQKPANTNHSKSRLGQQQKPEVHIENCMKSSSLQNLQRIKNRILDNIRKQSVLKLATETSERKTSTKKITIGKYLRYSQSKKHKQTNCNNTNDMFLQGSYESSNPITKHLYEKYKKLINKCV